MSAYNWILLHSICPHCKEETEITCQTHLVSSYDGDNNSRFCEQTYKIGEQMRWWGPADFRYPEWKEDSNLIKKPATKDDTASECCYASCALCREEMFVVIAFKACTPIFVTAMGTLDNWPEAYYK